MSYFLFLIKLSQLGVTLSRLLSLSFSDSLCGLGLLDLSMTKNWGSHNNQRLVITLSGTMSKPVQLYQKNACIDACMLSHVRLFATLWTVACQAPLPMGFPGKNTGVGCYFLLQGIYPAQRSNPHLLHWQVDSLPPNHWEAVFFTTSLNSFPLY